MKTTYDTIIIGARPAGAATAMLLAQAGQRVLVVDKAAYGSDTLSTHALMRGAIDSLDRWGLLESVFAVNTPVITSTTFTYGGASTNIPVKPRTGVPGLAAPRRTVLDPILIDAARSAGADVRHQTTLTGLVQAPDGRVIGARLMADDGTESVVETNLVVGADGLRSKVARLVEAPVTHQGTEASAYIIKYYADLDVNPNEFIWSYDINMGSGVIPTSDGGTCLFTALRPQDFRRLRPQLDTAFATTMTHLNPEIAVQLPDATQDGATRSWPGVPGYYRKAFGPGWALVGDAGYFKDPFAAQGISDALRDAELLAEAVIADDFQTFEAVRDINSAPVFETIEQIASYDWDMTTLPGLHRSLNDALKAEAQVLAERRSQRTFHPTMTDLRKAA